MRPLSPEERQRLECERQYVLQRKGEHPWQGRGCLVAVFVALVVWQTLVSVAPWYVAVIFWGLLGGGMAISMERGLRRERQEKLRSLDDGLARSLAEEIHIFTSEMVKLEEWDDEGNCYAFQIGPDEIIFVTSQDYDLIPGFPSSDVKFVRITTSDGHLLNEDVQIHGQPLEPVRTISREVARELGSPDNFRIIKGRLDQLETLLATA